MFVPFDEGWPPPTPWTPRSGRPQLTPGQQKRLAWLVGANLVLLLFAPLAGVSLITAIVAIAR